MLDPIQIGGMPSAQGVWERAYLLEALQTDSFDIMERFLANYGTVTNFTKRNVSANWAPTYVTCRIGFTLLIFIQGTENVKQVLLHLAGVAFTKVVNDKGILNSQWDGVAADILGELAGDLGGADPPAAVDISGHSYGGGVASLMARRLYTSNPRLDLSICTFGSPKASGGTLPPFAARSYVRVRNRNDMVPTLPPVNATVGLRQIASGGPVTRGALVQWQREGIGVLISDAPEFLTQFSDFQADLQASKAGYSVWVEAHPIYRYRKNLEAWPAVHPPAPMPPVTPAEVATIDAQPPTPLVFPVPDTSVIFEINLLYYGAGMAVVDAGNVFRFENTALSIGAASLRTAANISEVKGAAMGVPSGYTRFTLCINNTRYGRLETHVTPINITSSSLIQSAYNDLLNHRCQLLGSTQVNAPGSLKGLGNPQIQFLKIQDAFYPKQGYIVDLTKKGYFGPSPGGTSYPSDVTFTACSVRLLGTLFADFKQGNPIAPIDRYVSLLLTGGPDDAVKSGDFDYTFQRNNEFYWGDISAYLQYLTLQGGQYIWGFTGLNSHEQKWPITSWNVITPAAPAIPYWTFTAVAANFNAGDRVRITGANPNFNGLFSVTPDLANTYAFRNSPATGQRAPQGGFAQRVSLGTDGSKSMGFYPYKDFLRSEPGKPQIKISKKDPGREFLNVTFRKRVRKHR